MQKSFPKSSRIPLNVPFFYGWIILGVGTLGIVASIPGQNIAMAALTEHFLDVLGLTRLQLSTAYMLGIIFSGFIIPWGGHIHDTLGARLSITLSIILFGIILIYIGICDQIYTWITPNKPMPLLAFGFIFFGFLSMRFLGQGMLTVTSRAMMGKWFHRKRGRVNALSGSILAITFAGAPTLLQHLIDTLSWSVMWITLGSLYLLVLPLFFWFFSRDNPEECGLRMDGIDTKLDCMDLSKSKRAERRSIMKSLSPGVRESNKGEAPWGSLDSTPYEYTTRDAIRTFSFWVFNLGTALNSFILSGITFHAVALSQDLGLGSYTLLDAFFPMSIFNVLFIFLTGWLADRFSLKYILALMCTLQVITLLGLINSASILGKVGLIIGNGGAWGCYGTLVFVTWPRFFGRKHLGAISGWSRSTNILLSGIAPPLFTLSQNRTGSYLEVLAFCTLIPIILLCFSPWAERPQKNFTTSPSESLQLHGNSICPNS